MGAYVAVGVASFILIVMVVGLSLLTIKKGYGYKHSIDPLPEENENGEKDIEEKK